MGIMLLMGCNSGRNEITHNKGELRDVVSLKSMKGF